MAYLVFLLGSDLINQKGEIYLYRKPLQQMGACSSGDVAIGDIHLQQVLVEIYRLQVAQMQISWFSSMTQVQYPVLGL